MTPVLCIPVLSLNLQIQTETLNVYVDKDPNGRELLQASDPLSEALRFVKSLERTRPKDIEVWKMSFEVRLRQGSYMISLVVDDTLVRNSPILSTGKHLEALRSLRTAQALSSPDSSTSTDLAALATRLSTSLEGYSDSPLHSVVEHELSTSLKTLKL